MNEVYVLIKWRYNGLRWMAKEYSYYDVIGSFPTRKKALDFVKERLGAKYEKGYYISGDNLYTVKKTNYWE